MAGEDAGEMASSTLSAGFVKLCFLAAFLFTGGVMLLRRSMRDASQTTTGSGMATDVLFKSFQRKYLIVYLVGMLADWLQGPYVYALYASYGFTQGDIAMLFTAGFGSSALFGTVIGSLADRMGRRKFAMLYCVLYAVSCLTKHFKDFSMLLIGRITGGIATSLLFSVFDSWMVSEHNNAGFDSELLGSTFALAVFGNSIVAIVAGQAGQLAADFVPLTQVSVESSLHYGGYCSPFDVAIGACALCLVLIMLTWSENHGTSSASNTSQSTSQAMSLALQTIRHNPQVLYCGIVCSCFESAMFIFVFMWTPAITMNDAPKPPYGHIFSTFMVMSMLGSQIFSVLLESQWSIKHIGVLTLLVAAGSHFIPVVFGSVALRFFGFLVFECCVGMYFPMMGTIKGIVVPEQSRSAIYNMFRLPLNIIVVASLVAKVELTTAFIITTVLLAIALVFQTKLTVAKPSARYSPVGDQNGVPTVEDTIDTEAGKSVPDRPKPVMMGAMH